jgi:serine/threonine-protein kinase RIM15
MLTGLAPFFAEDSETMFKNIQKNKLSKPQTEVPLTKDCFDVMEKLMHKDPAKRLGNNGYQEILNHSFYKGLDI